MPAVLPSLLLMPRLRDVLDPRLALIADQNERESKRSRQARIALKRLVAKNFACDVQRSRGADICNYDAKIKLVDAKLEMVRAGRLF
jgi:hypothetical protein